VVTVGFTVIDAVVAPVLQRNDTPPEAVSVLEPPGQMVMLPQVMLQVGAAFTLITSEQELVLLLASVTVTVYKVVTVGLTVMDAVVAPVLQRNDIPPEAVSVLESPGQIDMLPQVMLHKGCAKEILTEPISATQKIIAFKLSDFFSAGVLRHAGYFSVDSLRALGIVIGVIISDLSVVSICIRHYCLRFFEIHLVTFPVRLFYFTPPFFKFYFSIDFYFKYHP